MVGPTRVAFAALVACGLVFLSCVDASTVSDRACSKPGLDGFPFCDTSLSTDQRLADLVSRIPTADKPNLLTGIPSLGVPAFDFGTNCLHGVQSTCGTKCATSFPAPNALGAAFNDSLVAAMAHVIGVEQRALWLEGATEASAWSGRPHIGLDSWSPNCNINRDPHRPPHARERRQYCTEYTTGIQNGEDKRYTQVVVTLKHWDAYSLEDSDGVTRHDFNAIISEYNLQATYFPAFKAAVTEGGAKGVMCSYNAINGVPNCASPFLNNVLRNEWGFEGYLTSDSGAIEDIYAQHKYVSTPEEAVCKALVGGGCDVNSGGVYANHLLSALDQGLCSMDDVDRALNRTYRLQFELGLFDPIDDQPYWHVPPTAVGTEASHELSLNGARQSLVLLQNDKGVLPLSQGSVAVIGPNANSSTNLLGNYLGQLCESGVTNFDCVQTVFQAVSAASGGETTYTQGCTVQGSDTSGIAAAVAAAKAQDTVVLVLGTDLSVEDEANDRTQITLPGVQAELAKQVIAVGKPTVVVLLNGGALAIPGIVGSGAAVLEAFFPGMHGAQAIAEALYGQYNPGGKLPYTVYEADYVNQILMTQMDMAYPPGRTYRYYTGTPMFPFGFGLSYTTFQLQWHNTTAQLMGADGLTLATDGSAAITLTAVVTNTGHMAGDEVVMAFYHPKNVTNLHPGPEHNDPLIKQLFGYQRVSLAPGKSTTVSFQFPASTLALVDRVTGEKASLPGLYDVQLTNGHTGSLTVPVRMVGPPTLLEAFPRA